MADVDPGALVEGARTGDRGAIARLLSLVETGGPAAAAALAELYPHTGGAWTVGITGPPGAGKSTLTDRLVARIRRDGDEVGVLAVDPTSPFSGGAILGDRVRMQDHATDAGVFIRSMATRGHLGGLALATPQAVRVLDAVGKPWVIIETVGVGQVEVEVASAADTTVVVVNPGWGDAVQADKAGLLEIADVLVVNKADRPGPDDDGARPAPDARALRRTRLAAADRRDGRHRAARRRRALGRRRRAPRLPRGRRPPGPPPRGALRAELRSLVAERLVERAAAVCDGPRFDELLTRVVARDVDPHAAADALLDS